MDASHFYTVIQRPSPEVISPIAQAFRTLIEADNAAQALCLAHPLATFDVCEPVHGHSYRAAEPRAERIYLTSWTAAEPASPPPADALSIATGGAL